MPNPEKEEQIDEDEQQDVSYIEVELTKEEYHFTFNEELQKYEELLKK